MVNLDNETIEAINKINIALKDTIFEINRFEVGETGAEGIVINLDIRKHEKEIK